MKKLSFLKVCGGLSMVVAAFAFLIFSVKFNPAKADQPTVTSSTGKYMMHSNSFVTSKGYYFHILVWNSETGKSKLYMFLNNSLKATSYQLPSSPLY